MITYEPVKGDGVLAPGDYRLRATIRAPYNAAVTGAVGAGFRLKFAAQGARVTAFKHAAPLFSAHDAMPGPWPFIVEFTVPVPAADRVATAGIDPRVILSIAALVATVAIAARLSSSQIDRVVTSVAAGTGAVIDKAGANIAKVFNPATLILAALIVALFTGAIARKG